MIFLLKFQNFVIGLFVVALCVLLVSRNIEFKDRGFLPYRILSLDHDQKLVKILEPKIIRVDDRLNLQAKCTIDGLQRRNNSYFSLPSNLNKDHSVINFQCFSELHQHRHYLRMKGHEIDFACKINQCNKHSICFFGECFCKPGFGGNSCMDKESNPWYTRLCPNLELNDTLDILMPIEQVGGEHDSRYNVSKDPKFCSYLCFSNPRYGTAVVPFSLWKAAQKSEGDLWKNVGGWNSANANDRAEEHWKAYRNFACISQSANLGDVIEVGAGPWTQLKGILSVRPDIQVSSFVVWEPSAERYMKEVLSCSYRSGNSLRRWDGKGNHIFPVTVRSFGGEKLLTNNQTFDTVITMNVLEHVQDAFEYLTGIYVSLKKGGLLIMHERYYNDTSITDGDNYHPIRIKQIILDKFLSGFQIVFNNCSAAYDGRLKDRGYYIIAKKL